ncbi:MAG: hypothetical protein JXN61_00775 [Sedimentisphaerales bacterium]|nr:hypothetical protein [Sedimentisphaerales bacterium]
MTVRLDMITAASRARHLLGDSAALVAGFIGKQFNADGGFRGRTDQSDLYYTVFGIEALRALNSAIDLNRIADYLRQFGDGDRLDFVHLACLVRCWANVCELRGAAIDQSLREAVLRRIETYRCPDGGYSDSADARQGTAYACFLALGAYHDLNTHMEDAAGLAESVKALRTPDGGYSNDPAMKIGATPATAAALTTLHYLDQPIDDQSISWLLSQVHPKGGFVAVPVAGSYGIPDLLSTATALHALALAGVSTKKIKENCLDFLNSLWSVEGAFCGSWADATCDCEYSYYGLLSLGHLSGSVGE